MIALPVIDMKLYARVKGASKELGGSEFPYFLPSMIGERTNMQRHKDWNMLYCFNNTNFFFDGKMLLHNWDKCGLKDSILGVERLFDAWYAVDIYIFEGTSLLHLTFAQRRALLKELSAEYEFKMDDVLPDAFGSRFFH